MSSYLLTADEVIALYEEEEIEAMEESALRNSALCRIDKMQIDGTYVAERKILQTAYEAERERRRSELRELRANHATSFVSPLADGLNIEQLALAERVDKALDNLWAGLESPDEEQRNRFASFYKYLESMDGQPLFKLLPVLEILEPAKRAGRRGRPARPQNGFGAVSAELKKKDAPLLLQMKILCAADATIRAAAREVVRRADGHVDESHAKRLERTYRAKMALRG